jgi:hypothetical protein
MAIRIGLTEQSTSLVDGRIIEALFQLGVRFGFCHFLTLTIALESFAAVEVFFIDFVRATAGTTTKDVNANAIKISFTDHDAPPIGL